MTATLPEIVDAAKLARTLGFRDKRWVYVAVERHGLPALRIGRSLYFDVGAVMRWLDAHRTSTTESTIN